MARIEEIVIRASGDYHEERGMRHFRFWLVVLAFFLYATGVIAQEPLPYRSGGTCPNNYYVSGRYCTPMAGARPAVTKLGPTCPSGWYTSGRYCVKQDDTRTTKERDWRW